MPGSPVSIPRGEGPETHLPLGSHSSEELGGGEYHYEGVQNSRGEESGPSALEPHLFTRGGRLVWLDV